MTKNIRIIVKRRSAIDLERLAAALLDLASSTADRPEEQPEASDQLRQAKRGRAPKKESAA